MPSGTKNDPWVTIVKSNPAAALRLVCFPYAGGNAMVYRNWADHLPSSVEVCAVQYPGRNTRMRETPFRSLTLLAQATAQALVEYLDRPFAFFGHSMGAKLAFELARLLRAEYNIEPVHLLVSGSRAPHIPPLEPPIYNLPEVEFIEKLRDLNGTPREVLEHPELMELMIPLLRADFEVVQTYEYEEGLPLNCPITAFGGIEDPEVSREHIEAWGRHTLSSFIARMLPGDHFFVNKARETLLSVVARELQPHITRAA